MKVEPNVTDVKKQIDTHGDAELNSKVEPQNIVSGNRISKCIEDTPKYRRSSRIAHSKYSPEHGT